MPATATGAEGYAPLDARAIDTVIIVPELRYGFAFPHPSDRVRSRRPGELKQHAERRDQDRCSIWPNARDLVRRAFLARKGQTFAFRCIVAAAPPMESYQPPLEGRHPVS
jgi:hypothetical protein